jgi:hypothetical protein
MSRRFMRELCATTALCALLATAPVQLAPDFDDGVPTLKANAVFARGGGDDGGRGGGGGDGGGRGGGDNDGGRGGGGDDGGRGRGGDDGGRGGGEDDGGRGRGGDDRGDDDHGGRGRGGDDRGDDDGRGRGRGGDDRADDDGRGRGRGGDDRASDDHRGKSGRRGDERGVAKAEIEGDKIEVTFPDGTKQEIEDGRFEQKNAAGRTVVERPATPEDFSQLRAAATGLGVPVGRASSRVGGAAVEVSGQNIEVRHTDGWKEEIEGGRYELKDPNNNTVVERSATSDDRSRLEGLLRF